MTWMAWRQFRVQGRVLGAAVAFLVLVLALTGPHVASLAATSDTAENFLVALKQGFEFKLYAAGSIALLALPAIIGVFWGAPLVARELEAGTHRLAWNQSITRTRWLSVKLAVGGLATVAAAGLCSLAVSWWTKPIDAASLDRLQPYNFSSRGLVPVGYAVFALVLGTTTGMVLRRTVPAIAVTVIVLAAVQLALPLGLRAQLIPPAHTTVALDLEDVSEIGIRGDGRVFITGNVDLPGAWVISNDTVKADGTPFVRPDNYQACTREVDDTKACEAAIAAMHLQQKVVYQPANRFWPLQFVETGLLLAAAGLLTLLSFWWLRRRVT